MVSVRGQKVYLDSSTVIYAIEGLAQYANLATGLLQALDDGDITAVSSELTLLEVITGARRQGDLTLEACYRTLLSPSKVMRIESIAQRVIERAIDLR